MSDLTNATGTHIDPEKFYGKTSQHSSFTTLNKFNQVPPNKVAWGAFRGYLRKWTSYKGKLNKLLGRWLHPVSKQRQQWPTYISKTREHMYLTSNTLQKKI